MLFKVAVYQMDGRYVAARSNELGFVNDEVEAIQ
jgi:hypothetical protein